MNIRAYKTAKEYLDDTENLLEQKELENNLILGLCNGLPDKTKEYKGCVFINLFEGGEIKASSIKLSSKAIVSCTTKNTEHIRALADHYKNNEIPLSGAIGETLYSIAFAKYYGKESADEKKMMLHKLTSVNKVPISTGQLAVATEKDIELLADWTVQFQEDANLFPRKNKEDILLQTKFNVHSGKIFKWLDKNEIVSIAAIVRKTRNLGFIGLVYTPQKLRGKGYATSTVAKLSEHVLRSGLSFCGLFTDQLNPTSNRIYKRIGYDPVTEFLDIEYK